MIRDRILLLVATEMLAASILYLMTSGRISASVPVAPWIVAPAFLLLLLLALPVYVFATPNWARIQSQLVKYSLVGPAAILVALVAVVLPIAFLMVLLAFE